MAELCTGAIISPFGGDIFRGHQMRVQESGLGWTILGLSDIDFAI